MTDVPFSFPAADFTFLPMPVDSLHLYRNNELTPDLRFRVDDDGTYVSLQDGRTYLHPVSGVVRAMASLYEYRQFGSETALSACVRTMETIMASAYMVEDAAFFPYMQPWNLHRFEADDMEVPWFSAMAQGYALMAFCRLYQETGDDRYLDWAHKTFASFLQLRADNPIWVVDQEDGYLWFELYPRNNGASDRTYNGHVYAIFGLYEYFMLTKDPRASELAKCGLATALHFFHTWRAPGKISWYCLTHREASASYHASHCAQLAYTFNMTAAPIWIHLLETFLSDWPGTIRPAAGEDTFVVKAGTHTVHESSGYDITGTREIDIPEDLTLTWDVRVKQKTELGTYIRSTDERYKFLLFEENAESAYTSHPVDFFRWDQPLELTVSAEPMVYRLTDRTLQPVHQARSTPLVAYARANVCGRTMFAIDATTSLWVEMDSVRF